MRHLQHWLSGAGVGSERRLTGVVIGSSFRPVWYGTKFYTSFNSCTHCTTRGPSSGIADCPTIDLDTSEDLSNSSSGGCCRMDTDVSSTCLQLQLVGLLAVRAGPLGDLHMQPPRGGAWSVGHHARMHARAQAQIMRHHAHADARTLVKKGIHAA